MKVAALWTGGKDSTLACYKAIKYGYNVSYIVTFIWEKPSLAHHLSLIKLQSEAIKIPFLWDKLKEPYFDSYREAILELKNEYGVERIITGDISYVDVFHGNWIDKVCEGTGVEVIKPLWGLERKAILQELLDEGFKVILTCVKEPWLTEDWLGRIIDRQSIKEIQKLRYKNGLDLCGEFGEYHTMTLDAPFFQKIIRVSRFKKLKTEHGFILEPEELTALPKWSSWR